MEVVSYPCYFKQALMKNATDAMKESRIPDFLASVIAQLLFMSVTVSLFYLL